MPLNFSDEEMAELEREFRLDGGILKAPAGYFSNPKRYMAKRAEARRKALEAIEQREAFFDRVRRAEGTEDTTSNVEDDDGKDDDRK